MSATWFAAVRGLSRVRTVRSRPGTTHRIGLTRHVAPLA